MVLAGDYLDGDLTEARAYFALAAERGHTDAAFQLGLMAYRGEGGPIDYPAALHAFMQSGFSSAHHNIGVMYRSGYGVPKDDEAAVYWYRKAAEAGYVGSKINLALLFKNSEDGLGDAEEAYALMKEAADTGSAPALYHMGVFTRDGFGVARDPDHAYEIFKEALENGERRSIKAIADLIKQTKGEDVLGSPEALAYLWVARRQSGEAANDTEQALIQSLDTRALNDAVNEGKRLWDEIGKPEDCLGDACFFFTSEQLFNVSQP